MQNFCQVHRVARRGLRNLFAAAETIGDDEPVGGSVADGRKKLELADGLGDFIFIALEAKRASHSAASGSGSGEVDADAAKERFFGGHFHDGFVMAVAVKKSAAVELRDRKVRSVFFEEFAEQECLARKSLSTLVVREEIEEFVTENGDATGLEADDRDTGRDFGRERMEDLKKEGFGAIEHTVIVEWASAAEVCFGDDYAEASGFEEFYGGPRGVRLEIVVECVGPQQDLGG